MARYQTNHETKECTETIIGKIAHTKKTKQNKSGATSTSNLWLAVFK